jgi:hypothetical protein
MYVHDLVYRYVPCADSAEVVSVNERVEATHPPIKAAIPKFTERVMVQLPISQIQPVGERMEVSEHVIEAIQFECLPVMYASGTFPLCASSVPC